MKVKVNTIKRINLKAPGMWLWTVRLPFHCAAAPLSLGSTGIQSKLCAAVTLVTHHCGWLTWQAHKNFSELGTIYPSRVHIDCWSLLRFLWMYITRCTRQDSSEFISGRSIFLAWTHHIVSKWKPHVRWNVNKVVELKFTSLVWYNTWTWVIFLAKAKFYFALSPISSIQWKYLFKYYCMAA